MITDDWIDIFKYEKLPDFRKKRKSLGLTLRKVETDTGISNAYLSQIETGKIDSPSWKIVLLLIKYYIQKTDAMSKDKTGCCGTPPKEQKDLQQEIEEKAKEYRKVKFPSNKSQILFHNYTIDNYLTDFTLQFVKDKEDLTQNLNDIIVSQSEKIQSLTEENRLLKEKISRDLEAQSATVNAYEKQIERLNINTERTVKEYQKVVDEKVEEIERYKEVVEYLIDVLSSIQSFEHLCSGNDILIQNLFKNRNNLFEYISKLSQP